MRAIICRNILVLTMCLLSLTSFSATAQSDGWIIGTWQLSYDPDGDSKDTLTFKTGNQFTNIDSKGNTFNGTYEVNNGRVKVDLTKQGKTFMSFMLGYEKAKDALHFYSEKTKKTSIYKKQ